MQPRATRRFVSASCWIGSWRHVSLQFWSGAVSLAEVEQASASTDHVLASYPDGLIALAVIGTDALPKLGEDARARISVINERLRGKILANVQVVEGKGFAGSGVRAILAGINLFNPSRGRIFEDVASAAGWIGAQPKLEVSSGELITVVEDARTEWQAARRG